MANAIAMLLLLAVALGFFAVTMKQRLAILGGGRPEVRWDNVGARLKLLFTVGIAQKKMFKEPVYGTMHAFIFWGFMVLGLRSLLLILMAFGVDPHPPGVFGAFYTLSKDVFELLVLVMVLYAMYRRLFDPPQRITASGEGVFILAMIGTLMITDFAFDGARIAAGVAPDDERAWAVVGAQVAKVFAGTDAGVLGWVAGVSYWVHVATLFVLLNFLPLGKHFHVITALPNVFLAKLEPAGKLSDMNLEDENAESFGTGKAEELTWKQMLDTYTCTECGRCTVNCPAWLSDKPLNPKFLINDIKHHLYRESDRLTKTKTAEQLPPTTEDGESKLILSVNEDVLWSCTTCRSCEENCPVMITHVDKIVDMRRYLVLTEAKFPKELNTAFRNLEQKGNPWGEPSAARAAWMKEPDLAGIEIPHISEKPDAEYLFWVGCAGAYDDRQKKVSKALVKLMDRAGVSFAVLGAEETCTGDPARRAGNEYLFKMLAEQNVETLNGYNVRKVVTHCPHCFNTLLNEYKSFGGNYDVIHHAQLISKLVADGRLKPSKRFDQTITFHDSCYLGRYNEIYDEPRQTLAAIPGAKLVEMKRSRENGMCCGAGGANFWYEMKIGTRVNNLRVEQAMEAQPNVIASSCPFCLTMLRDGVAHKQLDADVRTADIAELVLESLPDRAATQ